MDEYINRRKVAEIVCKLICGGDRGLCVSTPENCQQEKMLEFYKIPAEEVAPVVHGKWEPTKYPFMNECEDCSNCGYRTVYGHGFNYCPSCGAKMDGGE